MTTPRTCLWVVLDGLAGNYGDAVAPGICAGVTQSASCLTLLARRSAFKLGILAQTVP